MKNKVFIFSLFLMAHSGFASISISEKKAELAISHLKSDQKIKLLKHLMALKELYVFLSHVSTQHVWKRMTPEQMREFEIKIDMLVDDVVVNSREIATEWNSGIQLPISVKKLVYEIKKRINPLSAITRLGAQGDSEDILKAVSQLIIQLQ